MRKWGFVSAVLLCAACSLAQEASHPPGWVVIPVTEYQALRGKAYPPEHEMEPAVESTLTKVDYDLRLEGALASGRATLTVDVLKDGWVRVPIPQGFLVRESRMDGHSVPLVPGAGRGLSAVFSKKGRSVLLLDLAFPIASTGGEERLSLPASASGVTKASIDLGATLSTQDLDVKLTGGLMAEKMPGHWLAYARGNEPLAFSWRKKVE